MSQPSSGSKNNTSPGLTSFYPKIDYAYCCTRVLETLADILSKSGLTWFLQLTDWIVGGNTKVVCHCIRVDSGITLDLSSSVAQIRRISTCGPWSQHVVALPKPHVARLLHSTILWGRISKMCSCLENRCRLSMRSNTVVHLVPVWAKFYSRKIAWKPKYIILFISANFLFLYVFLRKCGHL